MPQLPCPSCTQSIAVSISQAGSQVVCPNCGVQVQVPKLGELKRLDETLADESAQAKVPADDVMGRRIAFGLSLLFAGIAAIAGVFCLVRYFTINVPATTEIHIAEMNEMYHNIPASQLVREWQQMERGNLEVANPYPYKKAQISKANWGRNSLICGGILLVAITAAGVAARGGSKSVEKS